MDAIESCRLLRRKMKLSQFEFARRFGLPPQTYAQWERGRRRPDKASELLLAVISVEPALVERVAAEIRSAIVESRVFDRCLNESECNE